MVKDDLTRSVGKAEPAGEDQLLDWLSYLG